VRRSLAWISFAVTGLVALAFLVPLAIIVGNTVRDRVIAEAFRNAAAIGPVLALTTDPDDVERVVASTPTGGSGRMTVYLPSYPAARSVIGPANVGSADVVRARTTGLSFTTPVPGGLAVLQPVVLDGERLAVVEVIVPEADLERGVWPARALLMLLAVVLVAGSVAFADRLAARVVRAARGLSEASTRLGSGDLDVRITPEGPAELREAAVAFNAMADRVSALLAAERELAADLSHRLRTPLTGLLLVTRALGDVAAARDVRDAGARLEDEIDRIIRETGEGRRWRPSRCDAAAVLRERLDFWGALAEDQGRSWALHLPDGEVPVPVPADDLAAATDALLGNVFMHTPAGAAFAVTVVTRPAAVHVVFADAGPGVLDPEQALLRGASGAASTGLGLDIARRLAETTGGRIQLRRSPMGGAEVDVVLRTGEPEAAPRRRRSPKPDILSRAQRGVTDVVSYAVTWIEVQVTRVAWYLRANLPESVRRVVRDVRSRREPASRNRR
jgi:signal transduction histidine kinase